MGSLSVPERQARRGGTMGSLKLRLLEAESDILLL
jgi:hypothetical protein